MIPAFLYACGVKADKRMRLVVKQNGHTINEFQFGKSPVYIGRHADSQIFLPDQRVSRHHAVIFSTQDGKWMLEDLNSANQTFLDNKAIHKTEIKTGDVLHIADFSIEINLEDDTIVAKPINLEDTLVKMPVDLENESAARQPQIIVRRPNFEHAPDIRLPARRAKDFVLAAEAICRVDSLDQMLKVLLNIAANQFGAYRSWCALRNEPIGPMTCHAGRHRNGGPLEMGEIKLNDKITQAVEQGQFLLITALAAQIEKGIQSAMIAPVMSATDCFGVLYIDNAADQEQYALGDLDYLMLLTIHTAVILKNF